MAFDRGPSTTRSFATELTKDQAVALYLLVASSPYDNGLGSVYADLGGLVRDVHGRVPGMVGYIAPDWSTEGGNQ